MVQRTFLQAALEGITPHVYFQPPSNVSIQYPCIVYSRDRARTKYADNSVDHCMLAYQVIVIDRNPDSAIFDKVARLKTSVFDRHYVADNLNHDVFIVYHI
jgi:hypothetical protein